MAHTKMSHSQENFSFLVWSVEMFLKNWSVFPEIMDNKVQLKLKLKRNRIAQYNWTSQK